VKRFVLRIFKDSLFPLVLFLIALFLSFKNYTPGTFLSGWDTLHPEFDFPLNIQRTFFGVFRPEQGLGALAAHAHMVELPRIFILYALHFFFPIAMLRYLYIFICLIAGPLGMYFFLNRILIKKRLPSFLGALFYLLNLGTYQTFLVPFEMFTTLFAFMPYVFWLFSEYLQNHKKRLLLLFSLVTILITPAAYASTLWFIFFVSLLIFFVPYVLIQKKHNKGIVKRFFILIGIFIALNLYWLLPNIYFAITQGTNVASANINKLFSDEAFLKNKEFGNAKDILLLKSFYFDWGIFNFKTGGFEQLTQIFQNYLTNPAISIIGYIFAAFFSFGFIYSIKKARTYFVSFLFLTLFCLLFLTNANPPFTFIFSFLQTHIPLFKEALRFPDDKILNIFVFLVSIFFSYAMLFFLSIFKRRKIKMFIAPLLGTVVSLLLILYMLPAFSDNLIHPFMRVRIPLEYFSLFDTLKKETTGRVANFPINSPWGWVYHDWYGSSAPSFQGAGFLYFGIPQSLMERDFDRWNSLNEQYYREMSHAVYSQNEQDLKSVIKKYDITDLLVDTSVVSPGADGKSLYYKELEDLLKKLENDGFITDKKTFGTFLTLYKVTISPPIISTLSKATDVASIKNPYYKDILFESYGNYISNSTADDQLSFPLTSLIDNESKIQSGKISTSDTNISLTLPKKEYTIKNLDFNPSSIPSSVVTTLKNSNGVNVLSVSLYPTTPLFDNASLLAPIKGDFEYPPSNDVILTVNRQAFPLADLIPDSPTALGSVFLNQQSNQVALFDSSQNTTSYEISEIPFSFGYCNGENNSDLNIIARPDSLVMTHPKTSSICISMPLSFIKTPTESATTLITINFSLNSSSHITACLTNPINGICNEYLPIKNSNSTSEITFAMNKNDLSNTKVILTVDKGEQEQTVSHLTVHSQQAISESILTSQFFKNTIPQNFHTVTIPKVSDPNYFISANEKSDFKNDCNNKQNIATKKYDSRTNRYQYSSTVGSFCDYFSFPNLPHALSYLVYVKSQNENGLPMNICITNYTSRKCDIYSKLSKFSTTSQDIFFLPQSDPNGTGYDINLENIGIKGTPSTNDLYSITFVPISYPLLSHIQSGKENSQQFPGHIVSKTIFNPLLLTTEVTNSPTLLTLSSAYHTGFHAYQVSCQNGVLCPLSYLLRPLFGNALTHIEVASWKNGWIVPSAGTVLIIFLPQYLEYLGVFVLVIIITVLITYPVANHFLKNTLDDYFDRQAEKLKKHIKQYMQK
jgi:hypothetical protein